MKRNRLLLTLIVYFLIACSNNRQQRSNTNAIDSSAEKTLKNNTATHCYSYTSNKDTILMTINTQGNLVKGKLVYKIYEKDKNKGTIEGGMNADTLIAKYKFWSEGVESVREVAFLKKGTAFVEGYGNMVEKDGSTVFTNTKALNFNSNVILNEIDCAK